jgi:hypothetical protein
MLGAVVLEPVDSAGATVMLGPVVVVVVAATVAYPGAVNSAAMAVPATIAAGSRYRPRIFGGIR